MKLMNVYEYEELPTEAAKHNAREWYRYNIQPNRYDWSIITEMFQDELVDAGYLETKVSWSLSYCQGDGVAFYGKMSFRQLDSLIARLSNGNKEMRHLWFKKIKKWSDYCSIDIRIERNAFGHRYSHFNTMDISADTAVYGLNKAQENNLIRFATWLKAVVQNDVRSISKQLEQLGYKEIEYIKSDPFIAEELMAGTYYFNADGRTSIAV